MARVAIIAENDKLVFLNQNRQFVISVVVTYVLLDLQECFEVTHVVIKYGIINLVRTQNFSKN